MQAIRLQSAISSDTTRVSNYFLDVFMPQANGEFVKIYLYLLRCLSVNSGVNSNCNYRDNCSSYLSQKNSSTEADCFCVSFLADKFNHTENDIIRALRYWENAGLIALEYTKTSGRTDLTGITLLDYEYPYHSASEAAVAEFAKAEPIAVSDTAKAVTRAAKAASDAADTAEAAVLAESALNTKPERNTVHLQQFDAPAKAIPEKPSYTSAQLKQFAADEELSQLLYIAQKYVGKTLTPTETNSVIFYYETLKMPADLIEFLLEYCVSKGHKSFRYMDKVAISWIENGIETVSAAKDETSRHNSSTYSVLNAFGITGRAPGKLEQDYINRWNDEYCFDSDLIIEACNRTILAIHQPSFEYADSILSKWKEKNIHTMDEVKELDNEFSKTRQASAKTSTRLTIPAGTLNTSAEQRARTNTNNRFNNFHQRDYDYDELEKQMLSNKLL